MARLNKQERMCSGGGTTVEWEDAGPHETDHWTAFSGERPKGVKRKRLKCSVCKRRLMSSVRYCDDGCHILHILPPHKPKGWWK
jgi:hypothetical protein